jgi:hypothetical protein
MLSPTTSEAKWEGNRRLKGFLFEKYGLLIKLYIEYIILILYYTRKAPLASAANVSADEGSSENRLFLGVRNGGART